MSEYVGFDISKEETAFCVNKRGQTPINGDPNKRLPDASDEGRGPGRRVSAARARAAETSSILMARRTGNQGRPPSPIGVSAGRWAGCDAQARCSMLVELPRFRGRLRTWASGG